MTKPILTAAFIGAAFTGLALMTGGALAQAAAPATTAPAAAAPITPVMATTLDTAKGDAKLTVTSTAFQNNAPIPDMYTQYGQSASPPLAWSAGPTGTQSYVVLTEDSGVSRTDPVFHWVIYDIPASATGLPQGVPLGAKVASPAGAMQGLDTFNKAGFVGPKPPKGQVHPYHFEVFAVDKMLGLDPANADRNAVVNAMYGHVLAEGELVGMVTGK